MQQQSKFVQKVLKENADCSLDSKNPIIPCTSRNTNGKIRGRYNLVNLVDKDNRRKTFVEWLKD